MVQTRISGHIVGGPRAALAMAVLASTAAVVGGGCAAPIERPLSSSLFMPPTASANSAPATTRPTVEPAADAVAAAAVAEPARSASMPDVADAGGPPTKAMILAPTPAQEFDSVRPLAPLQPGPTTAPATVDAPPADADPAVAAPSVAAPSPPPLATTPAVSPGVYMTVGGVLARVNDTPIYARTVLALVDRQLRSAARDYYPDDYQAYAFQVIGRQLHELIEDELTYSDAYKSLTDEERKRVLAVSAVLRQESILQAGGSLEMARRRAAEQGSDFDEQLRQQYRRLVVEFYNHRQMDPLIQVTAEDMRLFYTANRAKLYTDKDWLRFRVIQVTPDEAGTAEYPKVAALAKIRSVHDRALRPGQDFAELAKAENDASSGLKETGGDPGGPLDRGAYRYDAVEAALWRMRSGQVSDVIEAEGSYFVAKLEDKHIGQVKPFEDADVQADIFKRLRLQQLKAFVRKQTQDAQRDAAAIAIPDPKLTVAVDMAMQRYAEWNKTNAGG